MANKDNLFKDLFMVMAEELEKACEDWKSLPDTEEDIKLRERIIAAVKDRYLEE